MKIHTIINEVISKFLNEEIYMNDEILNLTNEILNDFLYRNNPDYTKRRPWNLVSANRLQKIWSDYSRTGVVRDIRGLEQIKDIMIENAMKLYISTYLSGHTSSNCDDDFEETFHDYIDYFINKRLVHEFEDINQTEIPFDDPSQPHKKKEIVRNFETNEFFDSIINNPFDEYYHENQELFIPENYDGLYKTLQNILLDKLYDYYLTDADGYDILSDYGTEPMLKLAYELNDEDNPNSMVILIDRMLNIAHQRSDLASWFIEGGSSSLTSISEL